MMHRFIPGFVLLLFAIAAAAAQAEEQPPPAADGALADILNFARPSEQAEDGGEEAEEASSPFAARENPDARPGRILLSDGSEIAGPIATTAEKPIRLWDPEIERFRDIPLQLIESMEAVILWERDEREYRFRQTGSDIKEFSGRTYPARETAYTVTLINGVSFTGSIVAPLYITTAEGRRTFVLYKRNKGELDQTLEELVYVSRVDFGERLVEGSEGSGGSEVSEEEPEDEEDPADAAPAD